VIQVARVWVETGKLLGDFSASDSKSDLSQMATVKEASKKPEPARSEDERLELDFARSNLFNSQSRPSKWDERSSDSPGKMTM